MSTTIATKTATAADILREFTIYRLANEADCGCPESNESAGATFLDSVRNAVIDRLDYVKTEDDISEACSEIADGAPDYMNYTMWQEFADLQAYQEDPTELGFDGADMEKGARICLYIIAERLAHWLFAEEEERRELMACTIEVV